MTRHKVLRSVLCVGLVASALPMGALADTADDLAVTTDSLEAKRGERDDAEASLAQVQSDIDALATDIAVRQDAYRGTARELAATLRSNYKCSVVSPSPALGAVMSSGSIDELVARMQYAESMASHLSGMTNRMRELSAGLEQRYAEVSAKKDEQVALIGQLDEEIPRLESQVDELQSRLDEERAERAASATKAAESRSVAETFATGDTDGWRTGIASAYGGWSDPSTGAVSPTATGAVCDDWSMGVAVPMAWPDYRSYLNRQVEISYNGQSVIATVNDCGYMGGGSRSLDLQPGVFKAFGFSDCDSWGLRTVSYRFL